MGSEGWGKGRSSSGSKVVSSIDGCTGPAPVRASTSSASEDHPTPYYFFVAMGITIFEFRIAARASLYFALVCGSYIFIINVVL
jgi:hypothetical protein